MKELLDVPYSDEFIENRRIDIYLPKEKPEKQCLFFIHGGGWSAGNKEQWKEVARYFCNQGYVCCSPSYRFTPQYNFPCQLEDVSLAINYIIRHSGEFGFSSTEIIVIGSSAGGHLAAMVGVNSMFRPLAVICYCSVLMVGNCVEGAWHNCMIPDFAVNLIGKSEHEAPELYKKASPYEYIMGGEPSFLLIHGDNDKTVPVTQSIKMHEKLLRFGVTSELIILPGVGHGFGYGVITTAQKKAIEYIEQFLINLNKKGIA